MSAMYLSPCVSMFNVILMLRQSVFSLVTCPAYTPNFPISSKSISSSISSLSVSPEEVTNVDSFGDIMDLGSSITIGTVDVLGPSETLEGFFLGVGLAFSYSFLQYITGDNFFVPWQPPSSVLRTKSSSLANEKKNIHDSNGTENIDSYLGESQMKSQKSFNKIFDADSWKEISRPENYVFYNRRSSKKRASRLTDQSDENSIPKTYENKLILISLLILFVPIFSIEFFFALSRQFMCGMTASYNPFIHINQLSWAVELCSAHFSP